MKYEVLHGSFFYKKEKPVFNDISFSVDEGKILAILGPNGAGKNNIIEVYAWFSEMERRKSNF